MALSAQIGYISCHRRRKCITEGRGRTQTSCNKTTKEYNKPTHS